MKKFIYNCKECGNTIVAEFTDDEAAPFMIHCQDYKGCKAGMMIGTSNNTDILTASHKWLKTKQLLIKK